MRRDTSTASLGAAAAAAAGATPTLLTEQHQQPQPEPEFGETVSFLPTPSDIDQQVHAAIQAMKAASPIGGKTHLESVRTLRQLLSNYENPPSLAVLSSDGIPALISALQPPQSNATSVETIFEAAWALTNLAVGEPEVVKAVVPAAPVLIAHLSGGSGLAVAEQCAWALGNIAGDDVEYKEILIANGAVPPLTQLLTQGVNSAVAVATKASKSAGHYIQTADSDSIVSNEDSDLSLNLTEIQEIINTGATASWALGNLLRSAGETEVGAFMSTEGASAALVHSLGIFCKGDENLPSMEGTEEPMMAAAAAAAAAPPSPLLISIENLCVETAWVLAYISSGPEKYLIKLIIDDPVTLVPILNLKLIAAVDRALNSDTTMDIVLPSSVIASRSRGLNMLTPLLRTLGNVVAAVGAENFSKTESLKLLKSHLIPNSQQITAESEMYAGSTSFATIKYVVYCADSAYHGLKREAAVVLANYAGTPGRDGVEAIKKACGVPALLYLLKEQPFHVRREAAFALANICAGGGGGTGDAEALNYLFGADIDALRAMLSLIRSADIESARLGLQFIEMLLRMLPHAVKEVESADGIDAIEALQFGSMAPPELQAAAAQLVDKYWGVE